MRKPCRFGPGPWGPGRRPRHGSEVRYEQARCDRGQEPGGDPRVDPQEPGAGEASDGVGLRVPRRSRAAPEPEPLADAASDGDGDGLLSARLAGALNEPSNGAALDDDFMELLAPDDAQKPAAAEPAGTAKPADARSEGKDPLWFLRQPSGAAQSNGAQPPAARAQPAEGAPAQAPPPAPAQANSGPGGRGGQALAARGSARVAAAAVRRRGRASTGRAERRRMRPRAPRRRPAERGSGPPRSLPANPLTARTQPACLRRSPPPRRPRS